MIRTWHIMGLLLAFTAAGGGCLGGDSSSGGGGGNAGGSGGSGGTGGGGGGDASPCARFFDCVNKCSDQNCQQACVSAAPAASVQKEQAFVACANSYNCTTQECITTNCDGPRQVCAADDGAALLDCETMLACTSACNPSNSQGCVNACGAAAEAAATAAYNALVQCAQGANCTTLACAKTSCPTEYASCIPNG
jgi:hypothetical protein